MNFRFLILTLNWKINQKEKRLSQKTNKISQRRYDAKKKILKIKRCDFASLREKNI